MIVWHSFDWFGTKIHWQDISFYDHEALFYRHVMISRPAVMIVYLEGGMEHTKYFTDDVNESTYETVYPPFPESLEAD